MTNTPNTAEDQKALSRKINELISVANVNLHTVGLHSFLQVDSIEDNDAAIPAFSN